jgi:hypothetical protein
MRLGGSEVREVEAMRLGGDEVQAFRRFDEVGQRFGRR